MTAEVVIGRLRTPLALSEARTAVAALEPLARDYGRGILIVRSVRSNTSDPQALRRQIDDLRRSGARPALGPIDPDAQAVFFSDEAELLLCLSEDMLNGRAADRWWWVSRLPVLSSAEFALAQAWIREPRWVPMVIHELVRRQPSRIFEVLRHLDAHQAAAIVAGIEDVHLPVRQILDELPMGQVIDELPRAAEPVVEADTPDDLVGPARVLFVAAMTIASHPGIASSNTFMAWLREARASGVHYAPSTAVSRSAPPVAAEAEAVQRVPQLQASDAPDDGEIAEVIPITSRQTTTDRGQEGPPSAWSRRPWEGSGAEVQSEMASALYAVNLVERLHLESIAAHRATGWAVVEAIIRRLLRDVPPRRRSALLADPLLPLLGELDTRPPGRPNPVRRGPWFRAVNSFLQTHQIEPSAFTLPGRIVVSRTHVDVVLGIDQIDLAVRASGLDQDPGWAPSFGRVILFHFEDTP